MLYLRCLLLDVILWFSLASSLNFVMSTILDPYHITDTVLMYFKSAAISMRFIIFNNLIDLDPSLTYARQVNIQKTLHQCSLFSVIHLTCHLS